jgi:hypothetical protein
MLPADSIDQLLQRRAEAARHDHQVEVERARHFQQRARPRIATGLGARDRSLRNAESLRKFDLA